MLGSSKVTTIVAVGSLVNVAVLRMSGTRTLSQLLGCERELVEGAPQSCALSRLLGVSHAKRGDVEGLPKSLMRVLATVDGVLVLQDVAPVYEPAGTTSEQRDGVLTMLEKYSNGS